MGIQLPGDRFDVLPLDRINTKIAVIKQRIRTVHKNVDMFPPTERPLPSGESFPDLPLDPADMPSADIEYYIFAYQRWEEYYLKVLAVAESDLETEDVRNYAIKAAIYDNYKSKDEFTASELQRAKIIEGAPEMIDAMGDLIEARHQVKMVKVQLSKLKDRYKKLSRVIELRNPGGRRNENE